MNHFEYIASRLCAEDIPLEEIAAEVGTPFYCYSTATLTRHFKVFAEALRTLDVTICYALKANSNIAVIKTLANLGAGADVVSEGELRQALAAGVPADRIVFSGVGKTRQELDLAVTSGILQINIESESELHLLSQVATARGLHAPIALRVNPDVDAGTHAKITTGKKENKFGIEWTRAMEVYRLARSLPGITVTGIACHVGSQLTDLSPFANAFQRIRELALHLRDEGFDLKRLDVGGGLGVPYEDEVPPHPEAYAQVIASTLGDLGCKIVLEPGRLLVGNAGVLVTSVIRVKQGENRTFVVVDAAMNDLIRPALYEAYHAIQPVRESSAAAVMSPVDVVGPVCESSDTFAKQCLLPPVAEGDLLAFRTAGAYGSSMSSSYNTRRLIPEVLVKGQSFAVVRRRPTYEEMRRLESLPPWL